MNKQLLRLFNAVRVDEKSDNGMPGNLERTIKHGYILDPAIQVDSQLLNTIESVIGISGEKANAAFHKSWSVIRDTPQEILWLQAVIHYFTTYGFEYFGIYSKDTIYIPSEKLELPDIQNDIPLTVIKAMTNDEILEAVINLSSGIALSQETLDDIMVIVYESNFDKSFVEKTGNRELRAMLYDYYSIVPSEPVEFLRYLISKLTDESLIIKNDYLIERIKQSNGKFLDELIKDAPDNLAEVFFRYKPLFLAMKSISRNKTFFNRLRKEANKLHKPLKPDYLNNITTHIKLNSLCLNTLKNKLQSTSIWRKVRLAYALNFRLNDPEAIVYRVRNGRGWATGFEWSDSDVTRQALDTVLNSIADSIRSNVESKIVYIPDNINYTLPATEKQFTGYLPTGSYVEVPKDLIVGIHWFDTNKRVDLDLSTIDETGKIGWDSYYRNETVFFSGDMTAAPKPNGASELFYIKQTDQIAKLLNINYFNFAKGFTVGCKLLAASEKPDVFNKGYMVDVNNIIMSANITISQKQNVLGLIISNRVYFASMSIGNSITSRSNEQSTLIRKYLAFSVVNSISLKDILIMAGVKVVNEKPDSDFIDLSPANLSKSTIIDLLR